MKRTTIIALLVLFLGLIVLQQSAFIVRPDQFAIVTEFGDPRSVIAEEFCADPGADPTEALGPEGQEGGCKERAYRTSPGLYFLTPFVQDVRYLDARVRGWDDVAKDTKTVELRTIDFTAFARWRISNPLRFYTAARTNKRAMAGMDSIVTARIQAAIREHKLASIVRDSGRRFEARAELDLQDLISGYPVCDPKNNPEIKAVLLDAQGAAKRRRLGKSDDARALRSEIVESIRKAANSKLRGEFGINIFDLHFKYLNYSPQVHQAMIESIKADRRRDIEAYRKVGAVCKGSIDQVKERRRGEITGERDRMVREIEGKAIASSIRTKARAFNQDPEFFRFAKNLELYEASLTSGTKMVLDADSPLLKLLNDPSLMAAVKPRDLPALGLDDVPAPVPAADPVAPTDGGEAGTPGKGAGPSTKAGGESAPASVAPPAGEASPEAP